MTEHIIQFGTQKSIFGIVTEPISVNQDKLKPIVLLLNSGAVHRIGPSRLTIELARMLADNGYIAFRFDLPNIGDSNAVDSADTNKTVVINTISMAMDVLDKRFGKSTYLSFGNCTGAMNSHNIAVADKRVTGAILLDGYTYSTMKSRLKRFRLKVARPNFLSEFWQRLKDVVIIPKTLPSGVGSFDYFHLPEKKEIQKEVVELVNRNAQLLYIFSGGAKYNYIGQQGDAFNEIDLKGCLTAQMFQESDHTYTLQEDRKRLISYIIQWINIKFSN